MQLKDFTLAQLKGMEQHIPSIKGLVGLPLAETYDDFIKVLHSDLDYCNSQLTENRHVLQNDTEDRLSVQIVCSLRCKGYAAEHDVQHGGHVDIFVRYNQFTWLGEAKIHKSYDNLMEGFLQLTTRYSTGSTNERNGGFLIYIYNKDAKSVVNNWKDHLEKTSNLKITFSDCAANSDCFFTSITHEVSGKDYSIRHMPVALHYEPQDKSARASREKQEAKNNPSLNSD